jgi:hypothetical protein
MTIYDVRCEGVPMRTLSAKLTCMAWERQRLVEGGEGFPFRDGDNVASYGDILTEEEAVVWR